MRFIERIKNTFANNRYLAFLSVIGAGFFAGNAGNDAGGIATYSIVGAREGYGLLWALILITFALAVVQENVVAHGGGDRQRFRRIEDLAGYRVIEREPIVTTYRGLRVVSAPPPSSGGVWLATVLNLLSGYDLEQFDSVTRKHVILEVMRRAHRPCAVPR